MPSRDWMSQEAWFDGPQAPGEWGCGTGPDSQGKIEMAEADPTGSSRIFISYRREDSAGHVLALLPALRSHFGADRIFKDTDNIPPGVDFVKFIQRELESCSVMLAII